METITKKVTKKDENGNKIVKEVTYVIDPSFVPSDPSQICMEFIINYCEAKGAEAIEWLCDTFEKKHTNKNGKETEYPFVMIRRDFCVKFFPAIAPKYENKPTANFRTEFLKKYRAK